jgi:hypothetical protein
MHGENENFEFGLKTTYEGTVYIAWAKIEKYVLQV